MRISDWSSDVCSSDLIGDQRLGTQAAVSPSLDHPGIANGDAPGAEQRIPTATAQYVKAGPNGGDVRAPAAGERPEQRCGRWAAHLRGKIPCPGKRQIGRAHV